jgi:hypothetical protein
MTCTQEWTAYNEAQTHEQEHFVALLRDLCNGIEQPDYKYGRPRLPLADVIFGSAPDDVNYIYHVFDCLYADGQPLDEEPWSQRQKVMRSFVKDLDHVDIVQPHIVRSREDLKRLCRQAADVRGSEGAMLKLVSGQYDLKGRSAAWAKYKIVHELRVKISGRQRTDGQYLYRCSFRDAKGRLQPFETQQKGRDDKGWEMAGSNIGSEYQLGSTYVSKIRAPIGAILLVAPTYITRWEDGKGAHYSWMNPRVREWDRLAKQPDTVQDVDRIADATESLWQHKAESIVLEAANLFMVTQPANQTFRFTAQLHSRGVLTKEDLTAAKSMIKTAPDDAARERLWKKAGFVQAKLPLHEITAKVKELKSSEAASFLDRNLTKEMPADIRWGQIVQRGNCHLDFRIDTPDDHAIGWTCLTPGVVLQRAADGELFYGLNRFEQQSAQEWKDGAPPDETVIRAIKKRGAVPRAWLTLVTRSRPHVETAPGEIGATEETAGIFELFDMGRAAYGEQKQDYHEYFLNFDRQKKLNGRWNVARVGDRWLLSRPKEQQPYITTHKEPGGIPNEGALPIAKRWGVPVKQQEEKSEG